jgi:hypothetical protein
MVALPGAIVGTLYGPAGTPVFTVYEFYTSETFSLRDATQATSRGNRTGALIVDNQTGRAQQITVTGTGTGTVKTFNIPPNGQALTVAQLAAIPPPDGPFTTIQDLGGLSPSLT